MNKLLMTTALAGLMALGATSVQAQHGGGGGGGDCVDCLTDAVNIDQIVEGFQKAFNNIKHVDDVTGATQTATNAANIISLEGVTPDPVGDVWQNTKYDWEQIADNDIFGGAFSKLENIQQSATNVVNVFEAPSVHELTQDADGDQSAYNTIEFGLGGYDADELYDTSTDPDELIPTQAALNAANLVTVPHLTGSVEQDFEVEQKAINTMAYDGFDGHWVKHFDPDVWDVGQTATNVGNVFSATMIDGLGCGCESVSQYADSEQLAVNNLIGAGWATDMSNIVQEATNVANSISYMAPPAP